MHEIINKRYPKIFLIFALPHFSRLLFVWFCQIEDAKDPHPLKVWRSLMNDPYCKFVGLVDNFSKIPCIFPPINRNSNPKTVKIQECFPGQFSIKIPFSDKILQIPNFTKWSTKMIFLLNLVSSSNFLLRIFVKKLLNSNFLWKFGYSFNS